MESVDEEFSGSVVDLSVAYLCILANGTPHYSELEAHVRTLFEQIVSAGDLVRVVEDTKHNAIIEARCFGLHLSDQSISEFCMNRVRIGEPLPIADQERLSHIIEHLQAMGRRIVAARAMRPAPRAARVASPALGSPLQLAPAQPDGPGAGPPPEWVYRLGGNQQKLVSLLWGSGWASQGSLLRELGVKGGRAENLARTVSRAKARLVEPEIEAAAGAQWTIIAERREGADGYRLELVGGQHGQK